MSPEKKAPDQAPLQAQKRCVGLLDLLVTTRCFSSMPPIPPTLDTSFHETKHKFHTQVPHEGEN